MFLCSASSGDPITLPESISSEDLTGVEISPGVHWVCTEVPLAEVSKWTMRTLRVLEKLGLDLLE